MICTELMLTLLILPIEELLILLMIGLITLRKGWLTKLYHQASTPRRTWISNSLLIFFIVETDMFIADKSLMLLNALYFKGKWRRMFSEKYTSNKCFRTPDGKCNQVPMMQVVDTFNYNYVPYLDSQAIVLPYDVSYTYFLRYII